MDEANNSGCHTIRRGSLVSILNEQDLHGASRRANRDFFSRLFPSRRVSIIMHLVLTPQSKFKHVIMREISV